MHSPLGLVIFVAVEGTFVCFTKGHDHFISNSIRCGFLRQDQCLESCMHWQLAVVTLRGGNELRLLIYAVRVCRFPPLFPIMFLDTLCSKKRYDMPHIESGIHSLQLHDFPHWYCIDRACTSGTMLRLFIDSFHNNVDR